MKLNLFLGFVAALSYSAAYAEESTHQHVHGEGCTHDHAAEHQHEHVHGEGCWDAEGNLICIMLEHQHDESCLVKYTDVVIKSRTELVTVRRGSCSSWVT